MGRIERPRLPRAMGLASSSGGAAAERASEVTLCIARPRESGPGSSGSSSVASRAVGRLPEMYFCVGDRHPPIAEQPAAAGNTPNTGVGAGWGAVGCLGRKSQAPAEAAGSSSLRLVEGAARGQRVVAKYARLDHMEQQLQLLEGKWEQLKALKVPYAALAEAEAPPNLRAGGRADPSPLRSAPDASSPLRRRSGAFGGRGDPEEGVWAPGRPEREGRLSASEWVHVLLTEERGLRLAGVSAKELSEALKRCDLAGGIGATQEELRAKMPEVVDQLERMASERLPDLSSEIELLRAEVRRLEDLLNKAFDKIDGEGKGFITREDLTELCETEDEESVLLARVVFDLLDSDRRGCITPEDFRTQMTSGFLDALLRQIGKKKEERQRFRYFGML